MLMPRPRANPATRSTMIALGVVLMLVAPIIGIIPGPGGIPVFAAGLALTLRHSSRARRLFVRAKRRWPWLGKLADIGLRRGAARRRRQAQAQAHAALAD